MALKRFSCFFLQVVADDSVEFESITTILAYSLVLVSIPSRKITQNHKGKPQNWKQKNYHSTSVQDEEYELNKKLYVCSFKSPREERRMEGSLLEAFVVRLSIMNGRTKVQIPMAATFSEV